MNAASIFLLSLLAFVLFLDYATFSRLSKRLLVMEVAVFVVGGVLIVFPEITVRLAHLVGIGRGVDFILYVTIIWLVRESLLSRHARWLETKRLTGLVRTLALKSAEKRSKTA